MRDPRPGAVFDGVWKKFRKGPQYDSLRDFIPALVRSAVSGRARGELDRRDFWALKDVSFSVASGDALGIMGPNGAGKSTILKLLTRLLRPTRGGCGVSGRVGALIELAAGFHPDLSGRENVYLQGAIMGMKRADITRRFDDIVDFAGISEFIDSPVKNYSSGMHARLGFAVAAHIDPDVLLIDEVLSVGDLAFQTRAMDRIDSFARSGMPLVIVSHQLERLAALCTKAILLDKGEVAVAGSASECIDAYVRRQAFTSAGTGPCAIRIEGLQRSGSESVVTGDYTSVVLEGSIAGDATSEEIILRVRALETGQILFAIGKETLARTLPASGPFRLEVELQMNVPPGLYLIESQVRNQARTQYVGAGPQTHIRVRDGARFYGMVQMNPRIRATNTSGTLEPPADGALQPRRGQDSSDGRSEPTEAVMEHQKR